MFMLMVDINTSYLQNLFTVLIWVLYFSEQNTVSGSCSEIFCVLYIVEPSCFLKVNAS